MIPSVIARASKMIVREALKKDLNEKLLSLGQQITFGVPQ
jgi:hypothetical protein